MTHPMEKINEFWMSTSIPQLLERFSEKRAIFSARQDLSEMIIFAEQHNIHSLLIDSSDNHLDRDSYLAILAATKSAHYYQRRKDRQQDSNPINHQEERTSKVLFQVVCGLTESKYSADDHNELAQANNRLYKTTATQVTKDLDVDIPHGTGSQIEIRSYQVATTLGNLIYESLLRPGTEMLTDEAIKTKVQELLV